MSADRRNHTHWEWSLALVVFWGRDGVYIVFVQWQKQGRRELWLWFLNATVISTEFFLIGPQLLFTPSTTMCNGSYLHHCEMQGAFRLPPGYTESMAKCKNQNHMPGCNQGKCHLRTASVTMACLVCLGRIWEGSGMTCEASVSFPCWTSWGAGVGEGTKEHQAHIMWAGITQAVSQSWE